MASSALHGLRASSTAPSPEDIFRIKRRTKGGRTLWYQMTILQQPERARACGSGMKANSDRRPIDPPPVIELRILAGPVLEEAKDVTFDYNANFFLYASLENAREIAHGRVRTEAGINPPILTGVPVSGMAYLDRPQEAGYFIFPDLSVRHENWYRLSFSLFETTKEENDYDADPPSSFLPQGVDWRMEIKTQPFQVYSAKKFPGLQMSTELSKTVAEQGCRVRIRREVRQRKRGDKHDYSRHNRAATPSSEDRGESRARSISNASEQRSAFAPEAPRVRPAGPESYAPAPPPPAPQGFDPVPRGHLAFGESTASQGYAVPSTTMNGASSSGSYPHSSSAGYRPESHAGYHYSAHRPIPPPCPSPSSAVHERHSSAHFIPPPSPSVYSATDSHRHRRDSSVTSYPNTPIAPAPPRALTEKTSHPTLAIKDLINQPLEPMDRNAEPQVYPSTGGKRKHDHVFYQAYASLHNRERQVDPHFSDKAHLLSMDDSTRTFRRASGHIGEIRFNMFTAGDNKYSSR